MVVLGGGAVLYERGTPVGSQPLYYLREPCAPMEALVEQDLERETSQPEPGLNNSGGIRLMTCTSQYQSPHISRVSIHHD